ncbi:MAG TPA: carboxypeptidase regulatory-like domain-containing protein [Candidatus Limnocylindrales bacterium]|nr:carboxypeptidase regulatory-like domain-containing protein [Candidatus Limnocylindrales bacterium]
MKIHRLSPNFSIFSSLLAGFALLALLLLPAIAGAQTNGLISGTVTDKSGAAVVGAKVEIVGTGGNLTRTTETNGDGVYVASALPSGTYNVTVIAKGFQKFEAKGVVLEVAQKARLDIALTVGAITEEVLVSGENVAQVDTQSSEISNTITGKQVQQLELNGRNFTQLVTLVPGVVSQTGQDEGTVGIAGNTLYSINGGRTEYNNWEIDGGDNMDNGSNSSLNVYPNLEAIAEFKVLTSNYGAQYGKNGSGTVEVETKSGTQQFHGSAFYYGRNDFFNANSWENNGQGVTRPAYKKHDWGYTIGGPVYIPGVYNNDKKKTFFFWSQEWRREIVPGSTVSQAVPSDDERGGNFNDVCFPSAQPFFQSVPTGTDGNPVTLPGGSLIAPDCPAAGLGPVFTAPDGTQAQSFTPFAGNQLPGTFSSTANALLTLIPHAKAANLGAGGTYTGGPNAGAPLPSYVSNPSYPTHWREELIRIDHNLTEQQRLTFRYIHDTWGTVNQGPLWGQYDNTFDNTNTTFVGPTTSFVAKLTSNFTPTLLNEFVASYTDDHIFLSNVNSDVNLPQGGIDLVPLFQNGLGGKIPAFAVGNTPGTAYGGGFNVDTGYFPWKNANPTYTYRDIVTKIIGKHTFFFGGYFVAAQKNQQSSVDPQGQLTFDSSNPNGTGNPFADLLLAHVGGYAQFEAQNYYYDRYKIFEPFFQDDWRVTKKLTLNLGLRWSLFGRYQEKHNQEFGFSTAAWQSGNAPQFFPFNDPDNSQFLDLTTGNLFNGIIQCGAKGVETGCMKNKLVNPGPRIGFAYDPLGDGKWAIRGGYGIFFEHMNGNEANAEALQFSPSPLIQNGSVGVAEGYTQVGAASSGNPNIAAPLSPISIPDHVQWPYMQQWNFGVEHELPAHVLISVAYVGSKGTHLTRQLDLNQLTVVPAAENPFLASGSPITDSDCQSSNFTFDATGLPTGGTLPSGGALTAHAAQNLFVACGNSVAGYFRPFRGYGSITRIDNSANSIYNSMQISARRTVGDLTLSLSYTYSHAIDNSSDRYDGLFVDSNNPGLARGSANFDIRHAASISYVYAIPLFKQGGIEHTLLGGWQISGITTLQTGLPFTPTNGTTFGDNAGIANGTTGITSFPDLVGNPSSVPADVKAAFAANGPFGKLAYNPLAFQLPVGLTFGDSGRNLLRLPGRVNFDFGLFKRFAFKERYAFEFRWENFNLFNHTQPNAISGNTSSGGAGATSAMSCSPSASFAGGTGDPTCGGFLVLNGSHAPRIMQFGLRFQF